jgi:two-component system chemotaxis response regulator CheY
MLIDEKLSAERLAGTKVLVVNDNHNLRQLIQNFLTSMGFQKIYQAANGPAGIDLINAKSPDVVIVDWEMGPDGQRVVEAVRSPSRSKRPDLPIIVLIGLGSRGRALSAIQSRMTKFLIKPVSLQSLTQSLAAVIN